MYLTKIGNLDLAEIGGSALLTSQSRPVEFDNRRRQRADSSVYVGGSVRPGEWNVVVKVPSDEARDAMIAGLDTSLRAEKRLEATRLGQTIFAYAALRRIELGALARSAVLTFEPTWPTWRTTEPATTVDTLTDDDLVTVAVPGNTRTVPIIKIKPTAQRSTQTADVGWKRRTRYRVTNNGDETLYRHPIRISLGSTTGVVSGGRALANGHDVRVWYQGRELARTLIGWNTATTYVWVLIPVLRPGKHLDLDIMWHNLAAGVPPVLAYPDLPAFDLATSSNEKWRYLTTAGNGAWWLSTGSAVPEIDPGVPGSWHSLLTLPNPDNVDDVAQYPYSVPSAGVYTGIFNAVRGVAGGLQVPDEGLADGISFHHPLGILSVSAAFSYRNDIVAAGDPNPVGRFVILARESGAQHWRKVIEYAHVSYAVYTPLVRTTYSATGKHVAMAVWPFNEIEVAEGVLPNHQISVFWSDYCDVNLDDSDLDISLHQAETEVYEISMSISTDPLEEGVTANILHLGAAGTAGFLDGPRIALELGNTLIVDCEKRTAEIWGATLVDKVEDVSVFAVRGVELEDGTLYSTSTWLPLVPSPSGRAIGISEADMGIVQFTFDVYGEYIP